MNKVLWIAGLAVVALSLSGCCFLASNGQPSKIVQQLAAGPVQNKEIEVEQDDAERVQATVKFGGGELDVQPGSEKLLTAEFVYNVDSLEPEITYDVQDKQGTLLVEHGSDPIRLDTLRPVRGEVRNEWTLSFSENVPLDLRLDVGASSGEIELGGLAIENLDLTTGAADLRLGFAKPNPERLASLHIYSGAAKLELHELGNANLDELTFDGGLGTYLFDFGGNWQRSADVRILAGASQVTLRLPQEIGVRVCPGELHHEEMGELEAREGCFVNALYDQSEITLDIDLDLGIGKLDIKQAYERGLR
jgi:hypothetical protein